MGSLQLPEFVSTILQVLSHRKLVLTHVILKLHAQTRWYKRYGHQLKLYHGTSPTITMDIRSLLQIPLGWARRDAEVYCKPWKKKMTPPNVRLIAEHAPNPSGTFADGNHNHSYCNLQMTRVGNMELVTYQQSGCIVFPSSAPSALKPTTDTWKTRRPTFPLAF